MAKKQPTDVEHDDVANALDSFLRQMHKDRPGEVRLLNAPGLDVEVVPTGIIGLDVALGAGGIPRGRIIEVYGPESGGKTTLALWIAGKVQELGGNVAFVDAEHALDPTWAERLGVNPDRCAIAQPDSGEDGVDMVAEMLDSGAFRRGIIIVDSVAAMTPKAEMDAEAEQQFMALQPRLMGKFMRKVNSAVKRENCILLLVNQVRQDLGAYGAPDKSTGGRAIRFYSSVRIEVKGSDSKSNQITQGTDVVGKHVTAKIVKNKVGAPYRSTEYDVRFGQGIDAIGSVLDAAVQVGVVQKDGARFTEIATGDKIPANGKEQVKALLESDDELRERIIAAIYAELERTKQAVADDEEEAAYFSASLEEQEAMDESSSAQDYAEAS